MTASKLAERDAIVRFLFAGKARFTFVSLVTGTRFTYRVERERHGDPVWFVSVLRGPCNESDYATLGTIAPLGLVRREDLRTGYRLDVEKGWRFRPSVKNGAIGSDAPSFLAFDWLLKRLAAKNVPGPVSEFWHEGKCGRCGRALTVPESIASGLGPECAGRMAA